MKSLAVSAHTTLQSAIAHAAGKNWRGVHWIEEIQFEDLLENDAALIFKHCGPEVLFALWQNLPGITLYLSEKNLFEIKKRYIRKYYRKDDPACNAKALAVKLRVSERFVYECLSVTGDKDAPRQGRLI